MSKISKPLVEAYKKTNFKVFASPAFILNIGVFSKPIQNLFASTGSNGGCFITAYNPKSQTASEEINRSANAELRRRIVSLGYEFIDGSGEDPTGQWPGEPSYLVLNIEKTLSERLGENFRQNAIVWIPKSCIPELLVIV
jgi:hypothetical protein